MGAFKLNFVNRFPTAGTVFFAARHLSAAHTTEALLDSSDRCDNLLRKTNYDTSSYMETPRYVTSAGLIDHVVLFFELAPKEEAVIYIDSDDRFSDAISWFSPFGTVESKKADPEKKTQAVFEYNVSKDSAFYISAKEGISCAMTVTATVSSTPTMSVCSPKTDPRLFYSVTVDRSEQYAVALSPKNTEERPVFEDLAKATLPSGPLTNACQVHRCRVYYAREFAKGTSYINWLRDNKCEAMGWEYDDWECDDQDCGYRIDAVGAPKQLTNDGLGEGPLADTAPGAFGCEVPVQQETTIGPGGDTIRLWDARLYSCGYHTGLAAPSKSWNGTGPDQKPGPSTWWKPLLADVPDSIGSQCTQTNVDGNSLIKYVKFAEGDSLTVQFDNIEWLTNENNPSAVGGVPVNVLLEEGYINTKFTSMDGIRDFKFRPENPADLLNHKATISQFLSYIIVLLFAVVFIGICVWLLSSSFTQSSAASVPHGIGGAVGRSMLGLKSFEGPRPASLF